MPIFGTRLVAALALVWGLLVWTNWIPANPVSARNVWIAIAAFGDLEPGRALPAVAGHAVRLAWLALLGGAALGAGRPAMRWLAPGRPRLAGLLAAATGAALLGFGTLGAGFAGLSRPVVAGFALVIAAAAGLRQLRPATLRWVLAPECRMPLALAGIALATGLLGALAPEISFDALAHHLDHPMRWAHAGRVTAIPHHFLSLYPALLESQYLFAWLLGGGPELPKLVHWGWGVLSAAVLVGWARESLPPRWALFAGAGFLLLPYVQTVLMWAYVDFGAAGYLTLACLAARAGGGGPALAGMLAGCAAGTKATGIFAPVLVAGVLLGRGRVVRRDPRSVWAPMLLAFLVVAAPWGARNVLLAGNPFAPFLSGWWPTLHWDPSNQLRYGRELASYERPGATGGAWLTALAQPWSASVRNLGVLDQQSGMGVWFLWLLPLLPLLAAPAAGLPARLALGFFVLWLLIPRQVRYLLPAWPFAAVAAAQALHALERRGGLAAIPVRAAGLALLLALAGALQREHFVINPVPVVFGSETTDQYLARGLPGKPYSVRMIARLRGASSRGRLLVVSHYGLNLYWGPAAVAQSAFDTPVIERLARAARTADRIGTGFRQLGITHVLYSAYGGFTMHAAYGMYAFDPGSAARWREFWTTRMRLDHNQDDRFLVFRPARDPARPGDPAAALARSYLPGLDEQWLGEIDRDLQSDAAQVPGAPPLAAAVEAYAAVARDTNSPAAWERLGGMRLRQGRFAEALAALRSAARAGRSTGVLHDALGVALYHEGRAGEAIEQFRRSLALEPGLLDARRNLVKLLWSRGRHEDAVAALREGLALEPEAGELRQLLLELTGREP